jgi:cell volume regulation protein A
MAGTDPSSVFSLLHVNSNKVVQFLGIEAIFNTPVVVILPLIIVNILQNVEGNIASAFVEQLVPLLTQIVVGVGTGVVLGLVMFKAMKRVYSDVLSPTGVFAAALLSYAGAEYLGGSGVLAVATLGLLFGNMVLKNKELLQEFNAMMSHILVILVFVLVGLLVDLQWSWVFFAKGFLLFIILIFSRLFAILLALRHENFTHKEEFFMALTMPKGIAVAIVVFSLSVVSFAPEIQGVVNIVLQLVVLMIVYSLLCSSIVARFASWFGVKA